jgi:predicted secreted protein
MSWLAGIFVYVLIWWVVLFAVLPWGVRVPDNPEPGHATSAPANPYLWRKAVATTVVSFLIWLVVYWIAASGLVSFRQP